MNELVDSSIDDRIRYWLGQGFRLTTQTQASAQLVKPRRFNPAEFVAMPLYLLEYLRQPDQVVYLTTGPDGRVAETTSGMNRSAYRRMQDRPAWQRLLGLVLAIASVVIVLWILNALIMLTK